MTNNQKIKKIKELRDDFLKQAAEAQKQLSALRMRQLKLLEKALKQKDEENIALILESFK